MDPKQVAFLGHPKTDKQQVLISRKITPLPEGDLFSFQRPKTKPRVTDSAYIKGDNGKSTMAYHRLKRQNNMLLKPCHILVLGKTVYSGPKNICNSAPQNEPKNHPGGHEKLITKNKLDAPQAESEA